MLQARLSIPTQTIYEFFLLNRENTEQTLNALFCMSVLEGVWIFYVV